MTEPLSQDSNSPRRDFDRLRLGVPAVLQTLDAKLKVEIVDISQGGAQLVLPSKDSFAKECLLVWLSYEAFGEVSWRKGAQVGIRFEEPISHMAIHATRKNAEAILGEADEKTIDEAKRWSQGALRI